MILKVFTIFDSKIEAYLRPFFCHRSAEAIRTVTDAVNDENSPFHKHKEDFFLYEVGTWDDTVPELKSIAPINLGCVATFLDTDESSKE